MRYSGFQIVFQEIPNEISLAFQITGCKLRCAGCHSSDLWGEQLGEELNIKSLKSIIDKYKKHITCVLYLGGEWNQENLIAQLAFIRNLNLKTALYTGLEYSAVHKDIINQLDYIKYGPFDKNQGPLSSLKTNQKLINLNTNEILNHYFINGGHHD
jgi:anaerobic ribonucleoside-triphosphate reductase activating protein